MQPNPGAYPRASRLSQAKHKFRAKLSELDLTKLKTPLLAEIDSNYEVEVRASPVDVKMGKCESAQKTGACPWCWRDVCHGCEPCNLP